MNICVYSIPRTGSTIMWNAAKHIAPDASMYRSHGEMPHGQWMMLCTIRDLRDAAVSMWDAYDREKELWEYVGDIAAYSDMFLGGLRSSNKRLVLRYEEFYNDYQMLLDRVSRFIGISGADQGAFDERYGIRRAKEISDRLESFGCFDTDTMVHGHHINHPNPGAWKTVTNQRVFSPLIPRMIQLGYRI